MSDYIDKNIPKKQHDRIVRFIMVGLINTLFNFSILNIAFYYFNLGKITSGIIATSCAMTLSFFLNRVFVFNDKKRPVSKFMLFVATTGFGILLLQNSVYIISIYVLGNHSNTITSLASQLTLVQMNPELVIVNLSNAIASLFVIVWNYNIYRIVVFNGTQQEGNDNEPKTT